MTKNRDNTVFWMWVLSHNLLSCYTSDQSVTAASFVIYYILVSFLLSPSPLSHTHTHTALFNRALSLSLLCDVLKVYLPLLSFDEESRMYTSHMKDTNNNCNKSLLNDQKVRIYFWSVTTRQRREGKFTCALADFDLDVYQTCADKGNSLSFGDNIGNVIFIWPLFNQESSHWNFRSLESWPKMLIIFKNLVWNFVVHIKLVVKKKWLHCF